MTIAVDWPAQLQPILTSDLAAYAAAIASMWGELEPFIDDDPANDVVGWQALYDVDICPLIAALPRQRRYERFPYGDRRGRRPVTAIVTQPAADARRPSKAIANAAGYARYGSADRSGPESASTSTDSRTSTASRFSPTPRRHRTPSPSSAPSGTMCRPTSFVRCLYDIAILKRCIRR